MTDLSKCPLGGDIYLTVPTYNEVGMNDTEKLQAIIESSDNIVFLGGAGVSTESGIKDFRGKRGIYSEYKPEDPFETPEYLLSIGCLYNNPERFFDNYRKIFNHLDAEPNITHRYLKALEDTGKLKAVVTQNIDGLHQKAGSTNVYEIHGTLERCHCDECNKEYPGNIVFDTSEVPRCDCGGMIRPDVVLYGEMLPQAYSIGSYYIMKAEVLLVAGTSLSVYPANGMIDLYRGKHLIIINDTETSYDDKAELVIHRPLGEVFSKMMTFL